MAMGRNTLKIMLNQCYIVVALLMLSCSNSDLNSMYGVTFNPERNKIGLPILDSSWAYCNAPGAIGGSWINPTYQKGTPCHFKKCFLCNNDRTMIWEEDIYIGPNKYTTVDGTYGETLYITYFFKDKRWNYLWVKGDSLNNSSWGYEQYEEISSKNADSLLTLWGLK